MPKRTRFGKCRLTGCHGPYVKAHLIPEALTETTWRGQPLTQLGRDGRRIKRWTSWYDDTLVTDEGEKILTGYDTWAISFFRDQRLIWSSWGDDEKLDVLGHHLDPSTGKGLRTLRSVDGHKLRLFLLSLLWRAAATNMFEFDAVKIEADELEKLRLIVMSGMRAPKGFFPVSLVQLSTRNFPHNVSPSRLFKREPLCDPSIAMKNGLFREVPFYRFYFDGLTAQFHLKETEEYVSLRDRVFVGETSDLHVLTVPSECSGQIARFWLSQGGVPPQKLTRGSFRI